MGYTGEKWLTYGILFLATAMASRLLTLDQARVAVHSLVQFRARCRRTGDVKLLVHRTEVVEALLRRCVHRSVLNSTADESITEVTRLAVSVGIISATHLNNWAESLTSRRKLLALWDSDPTARLECRPTASRLDDLIAHLQAVEAQLRTNELAASQAEESAKRHAWQVLSTKGDASH